jgi:hypothetical protein
LPRDHPQARFDACAQSARATCDKRAGVESTGYFTGAIRC